jgi:hypothetical protein
MVVDMIYVGKGKNGEKGAKENESSERDMKGSSNTMQTSWCS